MVAHGEEPVMEEYDAAFYRDLIDKMGDGVYFVDRARRITYWSRGAERLTGYRAVEVVGARCRDGMLNHVDEKGVELCGAACPLAATIRDGRTRDAHVFMHHADGHRQPVWVRAAPLHGQDGAIRGAIEVFSEDSAIASARAQISELERLALTDPLTGLGNRRFLEIQLSARLNEWERYGSAFGVLIADIDLFKRVNDTFGHDVGDQALAMVARTMGFVLRGSDVVGRYGGEEFVAILPHADPVSLALAGERLRSLVAASRLVVARQSVEVTISLGGAMVSPGDTADTLLRRADALLYDAKEAGRNCVRTDPSTALAIEQSVSE
jgi:diguanylate cyclase (GGDEF)-like protein/PAS domain S-box-containing protein